MWPAHIIAFATPIFRSILYRYSQFLHCFWVSLVDCCLFHGSNELWMVDGISINAWAVRAMKLLRKTFHTESDSWMTNIHSRSDTASAKHFNCHTFGYVLFRSYSDRLFNRYIEMLGVYRRRINAQNFIWIPCICVCTKLISFFI